jgi:hypothetical protein
MAAACRPPLTTVDMNLRELGRVAGEKLLDAIDGRPSTGLQLLPCSLVLRESSRPRHSGAGEQAMASAGGLRSLMSRCAIPIPGGSGSLS